MIGIINPNIIVKLKMKHEYSAEYILHPEQISQVAFQKMIQNPNRISNQKNY